MVPFEADEVRPAYRGATIAPWPNRVVDGRYRFGGREFSLALTEPDRGHALHGLTTWLDFTVVLREEAGVELRAEIVPQAGYPWGIRIDTRYELSDRGLEQTVTATNRSAEAAPYGVCPHPYLVAGAGRVDDWQLGLPADRVLMVSGSRLVPGAVESVERDPERFDFLLPRSIGAAMIDHAFTGIMRDSTGIARVEVRVADGGVAMEWDESCSWVQVYTADEAGGTEAGSRAGLAVEPMTCAPDAFNTGQGLVELGPGASHEAWWRIAPIR